MASNRRQYTAEFKAKLVLEVLSGQTTPSELCRAHKLNPNVLARVKRKEFVQQAPSLFERDAQSSQEQQRIAELERLCQPIDESRLKASIMDVAGRYPRYGYPRIFASPAVASMTPPRILNVVVLPAPSGPISPNNSPRQIWRSIPRMATFLP
jgi:transposase